MNETSDSDWALKLPARIGRALMIHSITIPIIRLFATPSTIGLDRLSQVDGPVIFVSNHSSHLDTSVIATVLPSRFRRRLAVAAGADYPLFFKTRFRIALWALWMNVIPIDRHKISRQSIRFAQSVTEKGWNLLIYPEGTRGPDDFALPFKPGAAYLAIKGNLPVVPIHIQGTRSIFTPYTNRIRPGRTKVTFGKPLTAIPGEKASEFNRRIELAVAAAADEGGSDWWEARRRAVRNETPSLEAPSELSGWRRTWASSQASQA